MTNLGISASGREDGITSEMVTAVLEAAGEVDFMRGLFDPYMERL